ncbi:MAG: helix-turn-helix domain-containing protein [Candidatus Lokiarchaeota archaeon]|nr:helix-turn-helix domain-containing protein [Candidatus Lokiarchaeota archaeon]
MNIRVHPNVKQKALFLMNFRHYRFVYTKILEVRTTIYNKYKNDRQALRDYSFR